MSAPGAARARRCGRSGPTPLRSFLTLLGIIIGVATLVGVVSVISGLNGFVQDKVIQLAPDVYVVTKFGIIRSREEFLDALKRRNFDWNDYERLRDTLQLGRRRRGAGGRQHGGQVPRPAAGRRPGPGHDGELRADACASTSWPAATSRPSRTRPAQAVTIIGADVKDELFRQLDPVGPRRPGGRRALPRDRRPREAGPHAGRGAATSKVFIPIRAYRRPVRHAATRSTS